MNSPQADKAPVEAVLPKEGATGWSDTWMVGVEGEAPQLRVHVDGLDRLARGERPGRRVLRRGAGQREGVRRDRRPATTATMYHAADEAYAEQSTTGPRRSRRASTAARTSSAPTTPSGPRRGPRSRADDGADRGYAPQPAPARLGCTAGRRLRLAAAAAAAAVAGVAYLGALAACFVTAFWTTTPSPADRQRSPTDNFR